MAQPIRTWVKKLVEFSSAFFTPRRKQLKHRMKRIIAPGFRVVNIQRGWWILWNCQRGCLVVCSIGLSVSYKSFRPWTSWQVVISLLKCDVWHYLRFGVGGENVLLIDHRQALKAQKEVWGGFFLTKSKNLSFAIFLYYVWTWSLSFFEWPKGYPKNLLSSWGRLRSGNFFASKPFSPPSPPPLGLK